MRHLALLSAKRGEEREGQERGEGRAIDCSGGIGGVLRVVHIQVGAMTTRKTSPYRYAESRASKDKPLRADSLLRE